MVSREQKKMQKKKTREKEVRKKVLALREKNRAEARKEKEERRREKRIERLQKDMEDFEYIPTEALEDMENDTLAQLEHNAKILKALEKEYTDDKERKKELNENLEDEGHFTLEDKMNALTQNTIRIQQEEAGVASETAEVDIVKCEDEENS